MNRSLPEEFQEEMRLRLGDELAAFLRAMEAEPVRGIRQNLLKIPEGPVETDCCNRIPWCGNGYYLPTDSTAGNSVLHEAGAWYIQDPSAMIPAAALNPQPGETVLDLCAAPGGKSTQIGEMMRGEGLLICNEPVLKRARVLSGNIERMGIPNAVVVSAMPEQLAPKWPEGFDAVLVDAPCSGEGMFRKNPETRNEWSAERVQGCAERQREILSAAVRMVRPGGRLVYSTCTFNSAENEENAAWLTASFPDFEPLPFLLPGISAPREPLPAGLREFAERDSLLPLSEEKATGRRCFPRIPPSANRAGK
jgi:tRNA and rRNA cytosine-C5-methylases